MKLVCCYLLSAFTLGAAPIVYFLYLAIGWSILNFFCLFLARGVAAIVNLSQDEKFAFTVVFANILFAGIAILGMLASNVPFQFSDAFPTILTVVIINMLPIQISVAVGCLVRRIGQLLRTKSVDSSAND